MRFRQWRRVEPFNDTSRKRAAFARSQRLQREKLPLFAELIAETQHDVDTEMARRAIWWPEWQQAGRDARAAEWRRARTRLAAHGGNVRARLAELWRACPYPADPVYLHGLLTDFDRGKLNLDRPPWTPSAIRPRTTPNPQQFGEAFRQIGQKRIEGGPHTMPIDQRLYCGNLGSGILFLTSRTSLVESAASVLAPAIAVPRTDRNDVAKRHVDIEVAGPCSNDELMLIERLARQAGICLEAVRRA